MGGQSGLSELSIISWMSAFEGCPLSGVPLYCVQPLVCLMRYQPWVPCCSWHSSERSERRDRSGCRYKVPHCSSGFEILPPCFPSVSLLQSSAPSWPSSSTTISPPASTALISTSFAGWLPWTLTFNPAQMRYSNASGCHWMNWLYQRRLRHSVTE